MASNIKNILDRAKEKKKTMSPVKQEALAMRERSQKARDELKKKYAEEPKSPAWTFDRGYDAHNYEAAPGDERDDFHHDREAYDNANNHYWNTSRAWAMKNGIGPGKLKKLKQPEIPKKRGRRVGQYKGD